MMLSRKKAPICTSEWIENHVDPGNSGSKSESEREMEKRNYCYSGVGVSKNTVSSGVSQDVIVDVVDVIGYPETRE